ncbi:Transmembrane protein [Quillaja saponaria]|uniref:Transmembrane protein n=1 Tax=Quillaja saponaria TaxID=32244 RepID=A0AAD7PJ67_QUISA|nr:Transmembrane protein [Quillaja saponaria]
MTRRQQDQQSRVFYELSALVLNLLRSPPTPISFSDQHPVVTPVMPPVVSSSRRSQATNQISPAGFASLLLGISLSLMLCGSVTFFIGFILMPWVLGLVMVFYVAGIVSTLSILGRSILCCVTAPATPRKEIPAWKIL